MSLIQRRYYEWDSDFFELEHDLYTDISKLSNDSSLEKYINEETKNVEFRGKNNTPHVITLKNNKVDSIWFTRQAPLPKNNLLFKLSINELTEELDTQLISLNDVIKTDSDLKNYNKSNVLYLVFRDSFITHIAVLNKL